MGESEMARLTHPITLQIRPASVSEAEIAQRIAKATTILLRIADRMDAQEQASDSDLSGDGVTPVECPVPRVA